MGASLAFAVQCAMSSAGWIVALADMPWIAASTSRRIAESLQAGAPIAAPRWQGRQGHPVGFSGLYRDELIRLGGDRGAKALLRQHHRELRLVDCDDPGILLDIDEPADLLRRLHHASDVD
jgi:molybdenum cofactor cytidylyltransferase